MYTLYGKPVSGIVLVGGTLGVIQPPMFYAGKYPISIYQVNDETNLPPLKFELDHNTFHPNYIIILGMENIDQRRQHIESALGLKLELERRIDPSFLDDVFYRLNPRNNKNQTSFVYRIIQT